ncbi:MAG: hypothetical protein ACYSTY_08345 [Planctomycetota bacterium]
MPIVIVGGLMLGMVAAGVLLVGLSQHARRAPLTIRPRGDRAD